MVDPQQSQVGWFDWLQQEPSFVPETTEDLLIRSVRVLELNGHFLYLKATPDLNDVTAGERRMLATLARQGDTVLVIVGQDPDHVRLAYRLPDVENAIAFGLDGLRGLIQQWFVWASTTEA